MVKGIIVDPGKPEDKETPKPDEKVEEQLDAEGKPVKEKGKEPEYPDVDMGDGEKVPFADLKKGFMRNKDYTQKTQKLAEDTKVLERFKVIGDFIDHPDNKDKAAKILKIVQGEEEELPPASEDEDPEITKLRNDLAVTKKLVKGMQDGTSERDHLTMVKEIKAEIKEAKVKYPELDEEDMDFIGAIAETQPEKNVVDAADKYVKRMAARDKTTIKKYLEGKEKDKGKFVEGKGFTTPPADRKISLSDGTAKKAFAGTLETLMEDMKE